MHMSLPQRTSSARFAAVPLLSLSLAAIVGCAGSSSSSMGSMSPSSSSSDMSWMNAIPAPNPDPRVGLKAGLYDAAEAAWNVRVVSRTKPSEKFVGSTNSDLAFRGNYVIQGNYNGYQIWDISNPSAPTLALSNYCPASQSDVSTYKNLLFVSAEGFTGRIDCGNQGVKDTASTERIRGIRIFDITDIAHPRNVANVQTCRGSHTHTVVVDPKDPDNVYVYISGSGPIRPGNELAGCVKDPNDPNYSQWRIEAIKVPLAHPEQAAVVNKPRIFDNLAQVHSHGLAPEDQIALDRARASGAYVVSVFGNQMALPPQMIRPLLDSVVKARGATGAPTAADSAALRGTIQGLVDKMVGVQQQASANRPAVNSCHDITVYPWKGLAGGACEGYGLLLDISNPSNPVRLSAVSDTNFSYWHSATFNNDGTKVLFSDEWGGGGAPKCRASDPKEWGSDAIFTIEPGNQLKFQSYYKMPAAQTVNENCVAHNGSLIPIPGRDVMVQSWYQGGISVFDWTDAKHPREIAFWDRGPVDSTRQGNGGTWSVYWYNGNIVSSEIGRGLDIVQLTPSPFLSQNEIDAARTVHMDYLNVQGQQHFTWPPSFALAKAYVDQLERSRGLSGGRISAIRSALSSAESTSGSARRNALNTLAESLSADVNGSSDAAKVSMLMTAVRDLSNATR